MPTPDYEWPLYDVAPQEYLHALGVISLNFNLYENGFMGFLSRYISVDLAEFLFNILDSVRRRNLILELIASLEPDHKVREHIEFLISHFATCAENRHILLHARVRGLPSTEILQLEKNRKSEPGKVLNYDLKISDDRSFNVRNLYTVFSYVCRHSE